MLDMLFTFGTAISAGCTFICGAFVAMCGAIAIDYALFRKYTLFREQTTATTEEPPEIGW
jgi:hypothetical protein